MKEIALKIYGKINLCLAVTGKNEKLHSLDTVMTSVDLYDEIRAVKRDDGEITVTIDGADGKNTNAYISAVKMRDFFGAGGADIEIKCGIPSGAGMGSSSADGAGVMRVMQMLYEIEVDENELREVALEVGSDVPYMLYGGTARMQGEGTGMSFYDILGEEEVLIAGKGVVNTGKCFQLFDEDNSNAHTPSEVDEVISSLMKTGANGSANLLFNDLQASAQKLNPHIQEICDIMRECGLVPVMTGSGAMVVGYGDGSLYNLAQSKLFLNRYPSRIIKFKKKGYEKL